jgi:hypothetical protein
MRRLVSEFFDVCVSLSALLYLSVLCFMTSSVAGRLAPKDTMIGRGV